MPLNTTLLTQIKQAMANSLVKQAAPPTFPPERLNPASISAPKPAPTSVDKAISANRSTAPAGPTAADMAIRANRRQNALGQGQLVTGTTPGASVAAPDYATARKLEDFSRAESVRAKMQNAGKYVADAASSAVGFGRSALDNAAAIKKHMDRASSSPVGYLASLGQNSGSPLLDRLGTSLIDPEANQSPVGVAAGGRNIMPNEYANYQASRAAAGQMAATAARPVAAPAPAVSQTPAAVAVASPGYGYPAPPASGNYNDPRSRLDIDDDQPTYQRAYLTSNQRRDFAHGFRPRFPGQIMRSMTMSGFDPTTPRRPYVPTPSGMQPSPPADELSYMKQQIALNRPRS